ncbi:hypothetical protein [Kitasatospora aureofaciens]|uniref:hypothetical protein n=1 Tax=Kitasatospora aureofaciens TaxID=1894 RepID=UPI001C46DCD5|nr:hypothetical protein [Kitasatospora aureofaciens]MBV6702230.1 hypothetical protein [Kitasatospora aureofaciens]
MTIQVELPKQLEEQVVRAATRAGLSVEDYVVRVLAADQDAAGGTRAARMERADALAMADYRAWTAAGCPEDGAMTMDDVFG